MIQSLTSQTVSRDRVLVIGAGVAGATCALELSGRGVPVDIAEKAAFPRTKACGCCIGGAGLAALEELQLRQEVIRKGVPTDRWFASLDSRSVELSLPTGVAISRTDLDPIILDAAINSGATLLSHCEATVQRMDERAVMIRLKDGSGVREASYRMVVVAAGLSAAGLNQILPWQESPHGPFGFSCLAEMDLVQSGTIYMACDDDGYVGLVRLADGRVDVAAALRSGSEAAKAGSPVERVGQLISRSSFPFALPSHISQMHTTPALRRTRRAGNGRVVAIGDAAGYVEPFTGEGMTWAMQSGIAAARLLAKVDDPNEAGQQWARQLPRLLGSKKWTCRALTTALRSSTLRYSAARVLNTVPMVAKPLLRHLSR